MSDSCNLMDCSLRGSSVHWILQTRILKWVAIFFSRDLPDPGIKPKSPAVQKMRVQSLGQEVPREGDGSPLWYSCLENPMDRGASQATVHGVAKKSDMT